MTEFRSFMGLAGYYRTSIQSFSLIVNLITSLQNKGVKFIWNQKYEDSFLLLKKLLTCGLVLKILNPNKEYVVCMVIHPIDGMFIDFDKFNIYFNKSEP